MTKEQENVGEGKVNRRIPQLGMTNAGPVYQRPLNVYPRYKRPLTPNDEILRLEILLYLLVHTQQAQKLDYTTA